MDIATFQTFLAAAATGSFAGAAQRVNTSPSSVTERIKQLEHRLGVKLFIRDKRGCQLTAEGKRFMEPAGQAVRAWEVAKHDVALPERFTRSLSFGGQYFLWEGGLMDWLAATRHVITDLAVRTTAGAWARLNRDLGEGTLDMIAVHDPVFRRGINAERLFDDRLVLVGACDPEEWRQRYVRIDWGPSLGAEMGSRLAIVPQEGLILDLGARSAKWLVREQMAGYLPEKAVTEYIADGSLQTIADAPTFDFPAYVCWRSEMDQELAREVVATLMATFSS